jgi:hypothetical protein
MTAKGLLISTVVGGAVPSRTSKRIGAVLPTAYCSIAAGAAVIDADIRRQTKTLSRRRFATPNRKPTPTTFQDDLKLRQPDLFESEFDKAKMIMERGGWVVNVWKLTACPEREFDANGRIIRQNRRTRPGPTAAAPVSKIQSGLRSLPPSPGCDRANSPRRGSERHLRHDHRHQTE